MIHDDLDLMQLARDGEHLACIDDVEYTAIHVVFQWPAGGLPAVYCRYQDWPQSHAARLATKDREIAELAALAESNAGEVIRLAMRVKELEALVAAPVSPVETPVQNQERMFQAQAQALDTPPDPVLCPECGGAFKNERALRMHQQRVHQGMQTPLQATKQFVEELGWHCAAKGCQGAHARDMHDPLFCTLHASTRQLTNGVEITA